MICKSLLSLSAVCFLASCSGFNSSWKLAASPLPNDPVAGRWEGRWTSEASGHSGKLRCIVGPKLNPEGDRTFTYWASWKKILSATFHPVHRVVEKNRQQTFSGSHRMPAWAGGMYTYHGSIVGGQFKASYRSSHDHGVFEMKRPP